MKPKTKNIKDMIKKQYQGENIKIFTLSNQEKNFIILAQKGENNSYRYFEVQPKETIGYIPIPNIFLYLDIRNIDLNTNDKLTRMRNKKNDKNK